MQKSLVPGFSELAALQEQVKACAGCILMKKKCCKKHKKGKRCKTCPGKKD